MVKKKFKHLIVIGHPDHKSFCYNGIYKTIVRQMRKHKENYKVIDLYEDKLHNDRNDLIKEYQDLITWSTHIYFISPVWWFRLTPKMETFFDEVLTPVLFISLLTLLNYMRILNLSYTIRGLGPT